MKLNNTHTQQKRKKQEAARLFLGEIETESTMLFIIDEDKQKYIDTMLNDLTLLAHNDCKSAAWALEVITEMASFNVLVGEYLEKFKKKLNI